MGTAGERPALWTRERAMVAGIGGFGALYAGLVVSTPVKALIRFSLR